jgi:hypothetical protein
MKPAPIDYDTVREMLRTATPDRVLRFIGKSHPADIALLFKGLESAEIRQLFDILFSSRRAAKTLKELPPELLPDIPPIDDEKGRPLDRRADPTTPLLLSIACRMSGAGVMGLLIPSGGPRCGYQLSKAPSAA